jgi:hypothetical protein
MQLGHGWRTSIQNETVTLQKRACELKNKRALQSRKLIEDGWEYVTDMEEYKIFRKPK